MVNIIEKGQAFYPTDHCGVLRCDTNIVQPKYLAHILKKEGLHKRFNRSHRASLDRIREISFNLPDINLQNECMKQVEALQKEIKQLERKLPNLPEEIAYIVRKYLE